jgi:hypothetical protein
VSDRPDVSSWLEIADAALSLATIRAKFSLPMMATAGIAAISRPHSRMPVTADFKIGGQSVSKMNTAPSGRTAPTTSNTTPIPSRRLGLIGPGVLLLRERYVDAA